MSAKEHILLQLSAYLDGELSVGEAERVTHALAGDADLRQELAGLANVRTLLRGLPRERAPEDFIPCVLAEAERTQLVGAPAAEEIPFGVRWARRLASAAVLLLAATIGVVIAITLWSPPRPMYEVSLRGRATAEKFSQKPSEKPSHPDGWASEAPAPAPAPTLAPAPTHGDAESAAPADTTAGDTATVDALAMLMKDGRAIDGLGRGEVNGRDLPPSRLKAGHMEVGERAEPATEELGRVGMTRGISAGNGDSSDPAAGGAGPGAGGAGAAMTDADAEGRDRPRGKGFAKDYAALDSGLAAGMDNNEVIFTDRLDDTQKQVEKVLLANGIVPAAAAAKEAGIAPKKARLANENLFSQNRLAVGQVQYEVIATPEQVTRVQEGLSSLRARQNVSQELAFDATTGDNFRRGGVAPFSPAKGLGTTPVVVTGDTKALGQDIAKAPQTQPSDHGGVVLAGAGPATRAAFTIAAVAAGQAPTTAPASIAKPAPDDAQLAMNVAKREETSRHRKQAEDREEAAEKAKKLPSPSAEPAAEERTPAPRPDSKPSEGPAAKPAGEPLAMAKPSPVAAPEPSAPPAAAPSLRPGKMMPSRAAGAKVASEDLAQKADQPASRPARDAHDDGNLIANAPSGHVANGMKYKTGWMEQARSTDLALGQDRTQQPAAPPAPVAATPAPPATAPAAGGGEAVVEVKVLSGHETIASAKQNHSLSLTGGGTVMNGGTGLVLAPAATQAAQGGQAIQLVTQQRLGEGQKAEGELTAQGNSPAADPQANQADQSVAGQGAGQGKLNRGPAGQTQQVSRFGMGSQPLRQTTSQSAAARVQRLLITVNFRTDGQSAESAPKAAAKTQTQEQRPAPDTKD